MRLSVVLVAALCGDAVGEDAPPERRLAVTVAPGYAFAWLDTPKDFRIKQDCGCTGASLNVNVGYRHDVNRTIGAHVGVGWLTGRYGIDFGDHIYPIRLIPIDVAMSLQINEFERYWATLFVGLHVSHATAPSSGLDQALTTWDHGLAVGLQLGVDAVEIADHRIAVQARFNGALGTANGYGGVEVGLAWRY